MGTHDSAKSIQKKKRTEKKETGAVLLELGATLELVVAASWTLVWLSRLLLLLRNHLQLGSHLRPALCAFACKHIFNSSTY